MSNAKCSQCGVSLSRRWARRGICRQCVNKAQGPNGPTAANEDEAEDKFWSYLFSRWWGHLLLALVFFGCAWLVYDYLTDLEKTGKTGRIQWMIALVYAAAGKLGAVSCFGFPAIVMTISGLVRLAHSRNQPDHDANP